MSASAGTHCRRLFFFIGQVVAPAARAMSAPVSEAESAGASRRAQLAALAIPTASHNSPVFAAETPARRDLSGPSRAFPG